MAAGPIKVEVSGLSELQDALRQLPDTTAKNVLRRTMKDVLQPIADAAARMAPVDDGALRQGIHVGTKLSRKQKSRHRKFDSDDVEMFAGSAPLPQAHLQEFGTSTNAAQPFMRPAWDSGKEQMMQQIKEKLWFEIQRAAERAARKAARGG